MKICDVSPKNPLSGAFKTTKKTSLDVVSESFLCLVAFVGLLNKYMRGKILWNEIPVFKSLKRLGFMVPQPHRQVPEAGELSSKLNQMVARSAG